MHQATLVGVCQRAGGVEADEERLGRAERRGADQDVAQAAAAQVLGDQIRHHGALGTVLTPVEHRQDVRVAHRARCSRLETTQERLVLGESLMEQPLPPPRDRPQLGVDREVDTPTRCPLRQVRPSGSDHPACPPGLSEAREEDITATMGMCGYPAHRGRARPQPVPPSR